MKSIHALAGAALALSLSLPVSQAAEPHKDLRLSPDQKALRHQAVEARKNFVNSLTPEQRQALAKKRERARERKHLAR